ncbi:MAG TPA: uroporphyrinogen-III synthase, partial [Methanomassiliicoccales archaeon]|nr:uroporphyrinogen-III synthase [Methanomassiliicoccales archaeon]
MTTVAIMRTKDKKEESELLAKDMGFEVRFASPLELSELDSPDFWRFVDELEAGLVSKVVVTSVSGLKFMIALLNKRQKTSAVLRKLNEMGGILAIGPLTAEAARKEWIKVEALPEKFSADGLAEMLRGRVRPGQKVWVLRSDKGSKVLTEGLQKAGSQVEEASVYTLRETNPDRALLDMYYWTIHG